MDVSKSRKMNDAVAVRDRLNLIVTKDPAGKSPEQVIDQILGTGVRTGEWNGMKIPSDCVAGGGKYKIKLQFPSKEGRNAFRDKYFPTDGNKKRSTRLKFTDDRVSFSCPQPDLADGAVRALLGDEGCDRGPASQALRGLPEAVLGGRLGTGEGLRKHRDHRLARARRADYAQQSMIGNWRTSGGIPSHDFMRWTGSRGGGR